MKVDELQEQLRFILASYKIPIALGVIGILLVIIGIALTIRQKSSSVEFTADTATASGTIVEIVVDVGGAVNNPGVYRFDRQMRVSDALAAAGSIADNADAEWVSKNINMAARISDGTKIYIPKVGETVSGGSVVGVSQTSGIGASSAKININTASESQLDTLYGVGPATAQKIIANRPYTAIEELVSKKAVGQATFEKIRDKVTIY